METLDIVQVLEGARCRLGALNGFVNLTAPEVRDFIEGDEARRSRHKSSKVSRYKVAFK